MIIGRLEIRILPRVELVDNYVVFSKSFEKALLKKLPKNYLKNYNKIESIKNVKIFIREKYGYDSHLKDLKEFVERFDLYH